MNLEAALLVVCDIVYYIGHAQNLAIDISSLLALDPFKNSNWVVNSQQYGFNQTMSNNSNTAYLQFLSFIVQVIPASYVVGNRWQKTPKTIQQNAKLQINALAMPNPIQSIPSLNYAKI